MTFSPNDFIDFVGVPFTVKDSRFLVANHGNELAIYYVRYEIPLAECVVHVLPFEKNHRLQVHYGVLQTELWKLSILDEEVRLWDTARGERIVFVGDDSEPSRLTDDEFLQAAESKMEDWMNLMPAVLPSRHSMAAQCWWVLGVNQIPLQLHSGKRVTAAVPSKIGYVGLWQWDTYFIAIGLRHGAPEIALEQLDIAFSPRPDGQLPDVIHESGTLSSSADLPPADLQALREKGRCDTDTVVPLTKPPLSAWAAKKVLENCDPHVAKVTWDRWTPILRASHQWWLRRGLQESPRYEHAYSSGLDDSPVFDGGGSVTSPDLIAYLLHQQRILFGDAESPELMFLLQQLQSLWDSSAQTFLAHDQDGTTIPSRTILSLLATFSGDISGLKFERLKRDVVNPHRFGSNFPLPTVSQDDPEFSPDEMWRGPTWINTNYLVAEGIERCGSSDLAAQLRADTLAAIEAAGGPVEYLNCRSGIKATGATTCFGWSAALYLDLAVLEAQTNSRGQG